MMDHFKVNPKDLFFILREQRSYGSLCGLNPVPRAQRECL